MSRKKLYEHFIYTNWNGLADKIKDMKKKHKLTRQKGFWGNAKTGVEMLTNF